MSRDALADSLRREEASRQALLRSGIAAEIALRSHITARAAADQADPRRVELRMELAAAAARSVAGPAHCMACIVRVLLTDMLNLRSPTMPPPCRLPESLSVRVTPTVVLHITVLDLLLLPPSRLRGDMTVRAMLTSLLPITVHSRLSPLTPYVLPLHVLRLLLWLLPLLPPPPRRPLHLAATEDAAGAEAEAAAADVALWDEARNVDIVDGDIVAMWDHLPGLQDDAASVAADLLAYREAEAIVVRQELEEHDFCCPVCYTAKDLQELACGHAFCRGCIPKFVAPMCPFCRRPL